MKKQTLTPIFVGLFILFSILSCKKDRIEKSLNEYGNLNDYLNTKKQAEQVFIIDSGGTGPIIGNQGTKIWISKSCLQKPNGDTITWPYIVKLVELYTPMDMIYYQMPSVSSLGILETDGEIRLRAFKDNVELKLKPYPCHCIVSMPNDAPKNYMKVYYGFENSSKPDWTSNLSQLGVATGVNPWFLSTDTGYVGQIARLGWIACDSIVGSTSGVKLNFVSTSDNLENVGVFVYFPVTHTVMQVYDQLSSVMPIGSTVKIVCIGMKTDGTLFHYYQSLTVNSNMDINVEMTEITDANLTTLLQNL